MSGDHSKANGRQAAGSVLALDIGGTKLVAGIGAADGGIECQLSQPTLAADGAEAVLERALGLARRCYDEQLAAGGRVGAIGVSTMGITYETHTEMAPNVPGWGGLRIPEALTAAFPGVPFAIGNDVKVAAQAELTWGSLKDVEEGVYLNLGSGIAAGLVIGGRLRHGGHGAAGEIGYSLYGGALERRMTADGAAAFEEWFGGTGAGQRLVAMGLAGSVAEVVRRRHDDPAAQAFVDELWAGIAVMTANLCVALDPTVVAVGGGYIRGDNAILERIQEVVDRAVPYPPKVVSASFGADASLRGAAALALALPMERNMIWPATSDRALPEERQ